MSGEQRMALPHPDRRDSVPKSALLSEPGTSWSPPVGRTRPSWHRAQQSAGFQRPRNLV